MCRVYGSCWRSRFTPPRSCVAHGPAPGADAPLQMPSSGGDGPNWSLGSGQLVGSFKHLHEESVDGGITNELKEKQMF